MTADRRRSARTARVPVPTRSAALLLLLAVILELLGQLIKSTGVTLAAAAALGAVIGDAALAPRVDGFVVTRDLAERLTAGIATTFRLTIGTPAGRRGARRSVVVIHEHPGLPTAVVVTPAMAAESHAVAVVTSTPERRGHWEPGGSATIEAFSPLGGFVRRHTVTLSGELWVHPAPAPALRLPDTAAGPLLGSSPAARAGGGTDFFGIREWRGGDAATAVHWRASARRNQLVVMEREQPGQAGVLVVCGRANAGESWERVVARSASTAVGAVRAGRTVVLVGSGSTVAPTTTRAVLDFFATLAPQPSSGDTAAVGDVGTTPQPRSVADAVRTAGFGATTIWLSSDALPTDLERVLRASGGALIAPLRSGAS